jgi:transcription initiation factor TFIIIB Brf1 subunit/transcription initiation factor TFIIB
MSAKNTKREKEALAMHATLVAAYLKSSPNKNTDGKEALADSLATQRVHLKFLREAEAAGTLGAEESRTLPAVTSCIKRLCESLHISDEVVEPDDDEEEEG